MRTFCLRGQRAIFFIGILLLSFSISVSAQSFVEYPETGKPCPDFVLRNIHYYSPRLASLKDFSGKWLVLDFWNKQCGACVASFPKVSELQQEFGEKVQFMMVGIEDREGQIEPMYAKFRDKERLVMPCDFDSLLAKQWDIYTAPYIIVIDPIGIVRAITYSLSAGDIDGFLDGHPPRLPKAYRVHEDNDNSIPYDSKKPFLIRGNGGSDTAFLFRSILTEFNAFEQSSYFPEAINEDSANGRFQILGAALYKLYNYAFYGKPGPDSGYNALPILEIQDSTPFNFSTKYSKELFCYSLSLPREQASRKRMQRMMQKDLENYFGYSAGIEERNFPCLRLIVSSNNAAKLLESKGGKEEFAVVIPKADFIARNWPFSKLLAYLRAFSAQEILDDTKYSMNIDIKMSCLLSDPDDVRKELQRYGLDLVPGEVKRRVLVIRDKP